MIRLARYVSSLRAALFLVTLTVPGAGCGGGGAQVIGPFVKEVKRSGSSLVVKSCVLVLQGGVLSIGECTVELVALVGPSPPAPPRPPPPPPRPPAPPGPPR